MSDGNDAGTWYEKWRNWVDGRGYDLAARNWRSFPMDANTYYIVQGKSPRGEYDHLVIYKGDQPYWDVHPSGAFLDGEPKFGYVMTPKRAEQAVTAADGHESTSGTREPRRI